MSAGIEVLRDCPACAGPLSGVPVAVLDARGDTAEAVLVECDCGFTGIDAGAPWIAAPVLVRPR